MVTERKWTLVPPQAFQSNGGVDGLVTVSDTSLFRVKQKVKLNSSTIPTLDMEVKRIVSPTQMYLGLSSKPIFEYFNLSNMLVSEGANISAPEQDRPAIVPDAFNRAVYEEEPVMAKRVVLVDKNGNKYDLSNPLPTNATFTGSLTVNLDGTGADGDTVGITGIDGDRVIINPDGSMTVKDPTLATILSSIFNVLNAGTLSTSDGSTHSALAGLASQLTDVYTFLTTETQSVSDTVAQDKLDAIIAAVGALNTALSDNLWTKLSKAIDRERTPSYSDVVVTGRTLKRLDYVEFTASSVSVSQKIRVSYSWLDFGTKDERVGLITRSVLPI